MNDNLLTHSHILQERFNQHGKDIPWEKYKIASVVSLFNRPMTQNLEYGFEKALTENTFPMSKVDTFHVPGAFEIPVICQKICPKYDIVITLGVVIRGETGHFDFICSSVTQALQTISIQNTTPILLGILTPYTRQQGLNRSSRSNLEKNKGYEVGLSTLFTIMTWHQIQNIGEQDGS